jgi:hypothetical protein
MFDTPQFGGRLHEGAVDGWRVTWEAKGRIHQHRLWCFQSNGRAQRVVCVVAFNPGSLRGAGDRLASDTTLRIIRYAMPRNTAALVLNLFTLATTEPPMLFDNWENRDCRGFDRCICQSLPIDAVAFAYGDYDQHETYGLHVRRRADEIRELLAAFPEVATPRNQSGNPAHPIHWQRRNLMPNVRRAISRALR